jgi:hypothetical protein
LKRFSLEPFQTALPENKTCEDGGAERDRTVGLLNAIEALSQLSYSPITDLRRQGLN